MFLGELLNDLRDAQWENRFAHYVIDGIHCDSREKQTNGLFVALDGFKSNGLDFIQDAIAQGASAIAKKGLERSLSNYVIPEHIAIIDVMDPKQFLRQAALNFYGNPSVVVKPIGVTGTNGKTTVTYLLESIIHAQGKKCGVIGTVNYRIGLQILPSKNTTPGFLELQRFLLQLKNQNIDFCVMETSSHALEQGRVDGIDFCAGIFTNLTQDHLDYHKNMEQYFQAKALLFTRLNSKAVASINTDDAYGKRLIDLSKGRKLKFGIDQEADVRAVNIQHYLTGTQFDIVFPQYNLSLHTSLIGKHNVYNILSAATCAYGLGFSLDVIKQGIESLRHIPGRLESVDGPKDFFVFIDYAHTEDGLVNVLQTLRTVSNDKIIVVFGCGGDRDKTKRPKMGQAVSRLADHAIVTSDNPRSEDPRIIIDEVAAGFTHSNFEKCLDRKEAIEKALSLAKSGEIVLLAGKGHEDYQVLKNSTIPFNERSIVEEYLKCSRLNK